VYGTVSEATPVLDDGEQPPVPAFMPQGSESGFLVGLSEDEMATVRSIQFGDVCDSLAAYKGLIDEGKPLNMTYCRIMHDGEWWGGGGGGSSSPREARVWWDGGGVDVQRRLTDPPARPPARPPAGRASAGLHSMLSTYMQNARVLISRREETTMTNWTHGFGVRHYVPQARLDEMTNGYFTTNDTAAGATEVYEPYDVKSEVASPTFKA
jgi:hypothetical protein